MNQKHNINNNLNELIYFTKILNNDYKNENEYILWTPKIRICLPNDELIEKIIEKTDYYFHNFVKRYV